MNIEWKYKIDLKENALSEIAAKYQVIIPDDLEKLLKVANAATPSKTKFMLKVDERVFGAILSFNPEEKEADSFETAMKIGKYYMDKKEEEKASYYLDEGIKLFQEAEQLKRNI